MASCAPFDPTGPYVRGLVDFVDCQAVALGSEGYQALGAGSQFGYALSGLLTIYIAFIGYRLLLGHGMALRDSVTVALRIGIVLALATQWAAYRPLVFGLVTAGSEEVASTILPPGSLGGDNVAGLINRVQAVNGAMNRIVEIPLAAAPTTTAEEGSLPAAQTASAVPVGLTASQQTMIGSANMVLLISTLSGILSVHVIAGLLLALGPLFVACLLFDATRGFLAGWIRVLVATILGGIAAPTVIALQLAILEPQVVALVNQIGSGTAVGTLPAEIAATTSLFALIMFATLAGVAMVAARFHLPVSVHREISQVLERTIAPTKTPVAGRGLPPPSVEEARGRAQGVADAVAALDRREQRQLAASGGDRHFFTPLGDRSVGNDATIPQLRGEAGRRTTRRQSAGGNRRDKV